MTSTAGLPKLFPRMDDPEHAVLRRMLTKDFTVKRVNALISRLIQEYLPTGELSRETDELEIALPTLLRRLPDLRLAVPVEEVRFRGDMSIYGVHDLPVTWERP